MLSVIHGDYMETTRRIHGENTEKRIEELRWKKMIFSLLLVITTLNEF